MSLATFTYSKTHYPKRPQRQGLERMLLTGLMTGMGRGYIIPLVCFILPTKTLNQFKWLYCLYQSNSKMVRFLNLMCVRSYPYPQLNVSPVALYKSFGCSSQTSTRTETFFPMPDLDMCRLKKHCSYRV